MTTLVPDITFDFERFTLDQLDRIVAVGETQPIGDLQLTLLSLECYRDGFAALALVEQDEPAPELTADPESYEPPLLWRSSLAITEAVDDRGGRYVARMRAGTGSDQGDGRIGLRLIYCLAPALDPAARSLTFTIMQVGSAIRRGWRARLERRRCVRRAVDGVLRVPGWSERLGAF